MTSKHTRLSALPCSAQVPDWSSKESLPPLALPPPLPAWLSISAVPLLLNKPEVTLEGTPGLSEVTGCYAHSVPRVDIGIIYHKGQEEKYKSDEVRRALTWFCGCLQDSVSVEPDSHGRHGSHGMHCFPLWEAGSSIGA